MSFFKKWPTIVGILIGLFIYIFSICTIGNSCYRNTDTGKKSFSPSIIVKGFWSVLKNSYIGVKAEGIGFGIQNFIALYNPWFIIPVCVIIANLVTRKNLNGFDRKNPYDVTSACLIVISGYMFLQWSKTSNKSVFWPITSILFAIVSLILALYSRYNKKIKGKPGKLKDKVSKEVLSIAGIMFLIFCITIVIHLKLSRKFFQKQRKHLKDKQSENVNKHYENVDEQSENVDEQSENVDENPKELKIIKSGEMIKYRTNFFTKMSYFITIIGLIYCTSYALIADLE